ncbi:hypothetical protein [Paracoccus tibetensis]|nr:hypothetical protein [Paracoccus tibetensis]
MPRPLGALPARLVLGAVLAAAPAVLPHPAAAEFLDHSHLLDLSDGSDRAARVRTASRGGYALSDGRPIRLRDWYEPGLPDLTLRLMTEMSDGVGITWGVSTGETGRKYRIAPALHLGFVLQDELFENALLTFSGSALLGGDLTERSCMGDYGEFGAMAVNCRLAATILPPEETLDYLLDRSGWHSSWLAVQFEYKF